MALTDQQAAAIERLRENESLTGNLTDKPAMAVLAWAEEQIHASAVYEDVVAAVRAANRTGTEDVDEALGAAQKSLVAALAARGVTLAPPPAETTPAPSPSVDAAPSEPVAVSTAPPPPTPPALAPPEPHPSPPLPAAPSASAVPSSPPKPQPVGQKNRSKRKSSARRQ